MSTPNGKKGIIVEKPDGFTERDITVMAFAMLSQKSDEPMQIDYAKLAGRAGYATSESARVAWVNLRKKIAAYVEKNQSGDAPVLATPTKRKKAAAATTTPTPSKKAKATTKKTTTPKNKPEDTEDEEPGAADTVSSSPTKKQNRTPLPSTSPKKRGGKPTPAGKKATGKKEIEEEEGQEQEQDPDNDNTKAEGEKEQEKIVKEEEEE